MPSRPQISREQILRTALEMLMEEGYESIRITTVAERLGCSTQPISWQFGGMEGFRAALAAEAVAYATERVRPTAADPLAAFYGIGTGYIDLAYDCPRLLRFITQTPDGRAHGGEFLSIFNLESIRKNAGAIAAELEIPVEAARTWMEDCIICAHGIVTLLIAGLMTAARSEAKEKAPITIVDEPLANVDSETAEKIEDILTELSGGIVFVITHHFSDDKKKAFAKEFRFRHSHVEHGGI